MKKITDYTIYFGIAVVAIATIIIFQGRNLISLRWDKIEADVIDVTITDYPVNSQYGTRTESQTLLKIQYTINAETYTKEIMKSNYRYNERNTKITIRVNPSDSKDVVLNNISWTFVIVFIFIAGVGIAGGIVNITQYRGKKVI